MHGVDALDEIARQNAGKSVFHFVRVKGPEQLKVFLKNPHARDASTEGVLAAAEVIAEAGDSEFVKDALNMVREDTELFGQTVAQLIKKGSKGASDAIGLLEPTNCDAVLAAAAIKGGNNLLHIALKNCQDQALIDSLVDRLAEFGKLGDLIGKQNDEGDLPIFVGLGAGKKCDVRLVPEGCAASNAKGQNILHFVCGVASSNGGMGGFRPPAFGMPMQLGTMMGPMGGQMGQCESRAEILRHLEEKKLNMKALFEQLDKDGMSPLNTRAMDQNVLTFALDHGVDLAVCSSKHQILTTGMKEIVYPCLKAHVHLVYDAGETSGPFNACNIESLNYVLQYAAGQNDHEVLKLVPACDDNQLLADVLYMIPPMHSALCLELAKLLKFKPSKKTAYFGLNLLTTPGEDVDQDFIRDKLMPREGLDDLGAVRMGNPL